MNVAINLRTMAAYLILVGVIIVIGLRFLGTDYADLLISGMAVVTSIVGLVISLYNNIQLVEENKELHKQSAKSLGYREDVMSSTFIVQSLASIIGSKEIKPEYELLLKVYSNNGGQTWAYKIMSLDVLNMIVVDSKLIKGYETLIFDSVAYNNADHIRTFETKYHCVEYARIVWELTPDFTKTPFGIEKRYS